jgi:hypothetical protein
MSKYTTEVRFICENYAGYDESQGYEKISDIIANSREKVFDFDYPIFDESYRSVLENKILRHFYLREICAETVGVWKHFLDMRMNEIMPYYNKLYESELIDFNPLYDVDLTRDYNKDDKGTGTITDNEDKVLDRQTRYTGTVADTGTVTDTGDITRTGTDTNAKTGSDNDVKKNTRWDIYSDTPQGALTNVENETYLTNARKITDDGSGSTTTYNSTNTETLNLKDTNNLTKTNNLTRTNNLTDTTNATENNDNIRTRNLRDIEDYIEHVKGKTGGVSFSKLLQEFRETFLNIDVMIINDLNDLFFGLW